MALTIRWTPQAVNGFEKVLDHLEEEWTILEILQLEENLYNLLALISKFPDSCPVTSRNKNLRKRLIDKNNYIVYRADKKAGVLEIINFRGTRQSPKY